MLQLRSSGKGSGQLNPVEIISSHRVDFWKGIRVWDWPAWLEINWLKPWSNELGMYFFNKQFFSDIQPKLPSARICVAVIARTSRRTTSLRLTGECFILRRSWEQFLIWRSWGSKLARTSLLIISSSLNNWSYMFLHTHISYQEARKQKKCDV